MKYLLVFFLGVILGSLTSFIFAGLMTGGKQEDTFVAKLFTTKNHKKQSNSQISDSDQEVTHE